MAIDVRIMCLGLLSEGDASGYEMQKAFKEGPFGHFLEASYGSIYPALTRLTDEGLVTYAELAQEGRPDKKVYSITEAGRQALIEAISGNPLDDKYRSEFLFMISFADLMAPEHVSRLIDWKIEQMKANKARLDDVQGEASTRGQAFVHAYGRAVVDASLKFLTENRALIEGASPSIPEASEKAPQTPASMAGE